MDVQFLEEHLQKNPDSILFAHLADVYLKMKKVEKAIRVCEEGIKKHPYYVTGHLVLGKCYLANKLYDQAEKEIKRVLHFDPKYLSAHKLYGDLMQEIGWENTCESSYKKILEIDPLDEVARSRVGEYIIEGTTKPEEMESYVSPASNSEIDLDSVAPMPLTSEEEELLFKEDEQKSDQRVTEIDMEKASIDGKKVEEFSSILDDIFKDEVVKEESEPPCRSENIPLTEDDLVSEIQKHPQSYFEEAKPSAEKVKLAKPEIDAESNKFIRSEYPQKITDEEQNKSAPEQEKEQESSDKPIKNKKSVGDKIVTPTLGEIYAAQGQYAKAINVFELLSTKHPDNEVFAQKIEMLKQKLEESRNAPKD